MKREKSRSDVYLLTDAEQALTGTAPKVAREAMKEQTITEIVRMAMNLESETSVDKVTGKLPLTLGEEIALKTIRLYAQLAGKQDSTGRPIVKLQDIKLLADLTEGRGDKRRRREETAVDVIDLDKYMKEGSSEGSEDGEGSSK